MKEVITKYKEYAKSNNWMVLAEETEPYRIDWITLTGNYIALSEYYDHPGELWIYGVKVYPE